MKFTPGAGLLLSLSAASLTQAKSPCKPSTCNRDNCLRAIVASNFPARPGTADCKSYFLTTVTPRPVTKYVTVVNTISPTTTAAVTVTQTDDQTATDVVSVVETDVVSYTRTQIVDVTDVETVTVTVPQRQTPVKRQATAVPSNIPSYASACSGSVRYSSACSCIGVTASTTLAPAPTVYQTVSQTATLPASVIFNTVDTQTISPTVATATVTTTFDTQVISQPVETDTVTLTDATRTITATATSVPPAIVTGQVTIVYPSGSTSQNTYGFTRPLNAQAYFIDGSSDPNAATTFELTPDGTIEAIDGSASGDYAFYSQGVGPTSFILVTTDTFAASQGGSKLQCSRDDQNMLLCNFGNSVGEWWLCGGHLNIVQAGYDFTNTCNAGGPSTKVSIRFASST
ncbi:hypothetical protein VTK73DRAFT_301 [Phialemonium thermophilum]|uniref:Uncharacterized protein n=1 Tax=Phialemonium thermophilum TaxID=223376 RepID=A0ABR3XFK5_9PEZI